MADFVMERVAPAPAVVYPVGGGRYLRWVVGDDVIWLLDKWGCRMQSRVPFWWEAEPLTFSQVMGCMEAWSEEIFEAERAGSYDWS